MKLDISAIDKNFMKGSVYEAENLQWFSIHDAPLEIRGLCVHEGREFCRLPKEMLNDVSDGVRTLSWHTAGGRVRFRTDSARIALRCESLNSGMMSHMPLSGSAGVDIYLNGVFRSAIRPADTHGGIFEGECKTLLPECEVELNLPLYNGITQLWIGVEAGSKVKAPKPYAIEKPVVYYGSSITQGGCASRPGNSYQGHIERWLDCDYINLGFSGNAKGEDLVAAYIAGLEMSAFVYDYDHNAPNPEHLQRTHQRFFEIIRKAQPLLPIVIVTKPDGDAYPEDTAHRREIIRATYEAAKKAGDRHVYFVNGSELFTQTDRDACTVDGTHPNDLGFYRMAQGICPVLKRALQEAEG